MINVGARVLALSIVAAGLLVAPLPGNAQTPGMEQRQERRAGRDDARAARQTGRHEGRDVKQECKDAGGNRIDCRQQKRATKHEAREKSRDERIDGSK